MERCDALVVGGGPAGSTLARALRSQGLDVVVMDKKTFPRDKVCAGWVTPAVVEALALDTEAYAQSRVLQPIRAFRTSCLGGAEVETRYDEVVSYGIRRCEFDHYLLERSGARLELGEPFEGMERQGDAWVVNDRIQTPLVVGAGGHFCPVARQLGAQLGAKETVVSAQEAEFEMTPEQAAGCPIDPETPELFFLPDLSGYAWVIRKGDYLNIGLGREGNRGLSAQVADFVRFLRERGKLTLDIPVKFHGHAYLLSTRSPRQLIGDGVLLIGDAAGLAYPQSGEGIRPAVESALMVAEVIGAAEGDYRSARLAAYRDNLYARFGRPGSGGVSGLLPKSLKQGLASHLLASSWFSRHVVIDRWFLHSHQAPLAA